MIDIPPYPKPPAQVAPYVDVLGLEYALKFLEAFGGVEVYIAQDPTYKGELVKVVGYANALALAVSPIVSNVASRWQKSGARTSINRRACLRTRLRASWACPM
jgi:hypothetical protein